MEWYRLKELFRFRRGERMGFVVLCAIIAFFACVRLLHTAADKPSFADSLQVAEHRGDSFRHGNAKARSEQEMTRRTAEVQLQLFDPNSADSATLCSLGLPPWMARNVVKYRSKGGSFKKPEDFRKIYGMTDELFASLLPYISIQLPRAESHSAEQRTPSDYRTRDTVPMLLDTASIRSSYAKAEKYPVGTKVDLNKADTTELKKIPGIGSYIARNIVKYRRQLGGYASVGQLREIHLRSELLEEWFVVDTMDIQKIDLNRVSVEKLMKHPYFNFYQAKSVVEYRRNRGELRSLAPFADSEGFTEKDIQRMAPYICF